MPRTRKMLQTTDDTENLGCRSSKRIKNQLVQLSTQSQEKHMDNEAKKFVSKETQVNLEITAEDLTNPDGASATYWELLAEKRLASLNEALEENDKLKQVIENLTQELILNQKLLEEANSFVEVIKEELANASNNDTGIDVNDVSTSEDTLNDTNNTVNDTADDSNADIKTELNASKDHK